MNKVLFVVAMLLMFLLNIGTGIVAAQQPNLFTVTTMPPLTTNQTQAYLVVKQMPMVDSIWFVNFKLLSVAQSNGKIKIELPNTICGKSAPFYYTAKEVEFDSDSNFIWVGELDSECDTCLDCNDGYFTLIAEQGNIFGHLTLGEETYEIFNLGGVSVLGKLKQELKNNIGCGVIDTPIVDTPKVEEFGGRVKAEYGNCRVTVGVIYNQEALQKVPDINATIRLALSQTRTALQNSNIPASQLDLVYVGAMQVQYNATFINDISSDLFYFKNNANVLAARQALKADLLVLLTGEDYGMPNGGNPTGVATRPTSILGNSNAAFAIVEANMATSNRYTFAHELGHLFGAGHQVEYDPTPGIAHGHIISKGCYLNWISCKDYYTIMVTSVPDFAIKNKILHYSNPDINYKGKPTGISGSRHNAQRIREMGCIVSKYMLNQDDVLNATITGSLWGCAGESITLQGLAIGGSPAYTYAWQISNDGINYGAVLGNSTQFTINTLPLLAGSRIWVKLTVNDGVGGVHSRVHVITVTNSGQGGVLCQKRLHRTKTTTDFSENSIRILSNPINDNQLSLELNLLEDDFVSISIYDALGRLVARVAQQAYLKGTSLENLALDNITAGQYYIRMDGKFGTLVAKFIKL